MVQVTQSSRPMVIDLAVIGQIRALEARGSQGLLRKLVVKFADTGPATVADMRAMFVTGDPETLWRGAHGLKSSAGIVGGVQVSARCVEIERVVRRDGTAAAAALIDQLDAAADAAIEQLKALSSDDDATAR